MSWFRRKKEEEVEKLFLEHLDLVVDSVRGFKRTLYYYIEHYDEIRSNSRIEREFKDTSYHVHLQEGRADELRRRIGTLLYSGAYMPLYREDYLLLIEAFDFIAGRAEGFCDMLVLQRPMIPDELSRYLKEIADVSSDMVEKLKEAFERFLEDMEDAVMICHQIEDAEARVDKLEWDAMKAIFSNESLDLAEKLQLKELVEKAAIISDAIENASDRIEIMAVKRKV